MAAAVRWHPAHETKIGETHEQLAAEIRAEALPGQFVKTIEIGWRTTCLEVPTLRDGAPF